MNWSYVAGMFDGEGSIVPVAKQSYKITIASNNTEVLECIKEFLACQGIYSWISERRHKNPKHATGYSLCLSKSEYVRTFIKSTLPDLIIKKQKVTDALEHITTKNIKQPTDDDYRRAKALLDNGFSYNEVIEVLGIQFSFGKLGKLCGGRPNALKGTTWKTINGRRTVFSGITG